MPDFAQLGVGAFSIFGILLSIMITALFVIGPVERRDRTLFRMGLDSVTVLAVYAAGLGFLYTLRGRS